jgi:hypothetical protein
MVTINGFFDESERQEANDPIVVAGYLFKQRGYSSLQRLWRHHVLLHGRLRHFHTTDLVAGQGVYKGMDISKRQEILTAAVAAIVSHMYAGIAVHFDRTEFEAVAPSDWPERYGSIYTTACNGCLELASEWMRDERSHLSVRYVFERGHKFRAQADSLLTALGGDLDARRQLRYAQHAFEEKDAEYGLQAADLLAWFLARVMVTSKASASLRPFLSSLKPLVTRDNSRYRLRPMTGTALRTFIDNNRAARWPGFAAEVGPRKRTFR